jgi:hypothetical protein
MRARGPTAFVVAAAFAASVYAQSRATDEGRPLERPDNYYAAANRIQITTPKSGDVVVAGRQIDIGQPVGGDILAAGWRVNLSGLADDDVRIAAAEVTIKAPVRGDLTVAGGDVSVGSNAKVGGRSWVTGNVVRLDGVFERELRIAGATVQIGGEVRKPLYVIADTLEVLPSARILAPLTYRATREARIGQGAVVSGPITYDRIEPREARDARAVPGVSTFLFSVHLVLAGLLVVIFLPSVETSVVATLRRHPWRSMLAGFVLLVSVPIAALLLVASIVALPIGITLAATYAGGLFAAVLATAMWVGDVERCLFKAGPAVSRGQHAMMLLAGVLTLAVLRSLVGGLVVFAAVLFGLGALLLAAYDQYGRTMKAAA